VKNANQIFTNGKDWQKQEELYERFGSSFPFGVYVTGEKIFCVGFEEGEGASVYRGKIKN